jgi:hypothetical protein
MKISAEFQNLGIQNMSLGISGLLEVEPSFKKTKQRLQGKCMYKPNK